MSDPIADMLTRIRNGLKANRTEVSMPSSNTKAAIAKVLSEEGYVGEVKVSDDGGKPELTINLKYVNGVPAIETIERMSRPGRRLYSGVKDLTTVRGGLGVAIVSTSKGIMTEKSARKAGAGGEIICTVF